MSTNLIATEVFRCMTQDYAEALMIPNDLANHLLGLNRSRDIAKILDIIDTTLSDTQYSDKSLVIALRQLRALFSKNTSYARKDCDLVAFSSFVNSEEKCANTNRRLDNIAGMLLSGHYPLINRMAAHIERVLGDYESFRLNFLPNNLRVSGGASATRSRRVASINRKTRRALEVNEYTFGLYREMFPDIRLRPILCNTNRVTFVPKNYRTSRTIACEPAHNVCVQLAFDAYCKRRLRANGVYLDDQSYNQLAAFKGSLDGSLATIDLKAASDSVSLVLIDLLFPSNWASFLKGTRSRFWRTEVDGEVKAGAYEKYSSMGNGTTFPVESLIFSAACRAVGSKQSIVYGDDIVIEDELSEQLIELLAFLGFEVNGDKSFTGSTPFRESCGTDWIRGVNVTPFYMRQDISKWDLTHLPDACHIVNGLARQIVGNRLKELLLSVVKDRRLLTGPVVDDTRRWVFVSKPRLRTKGGLTYCRGYMVKQLSRENYFTLGYYYALYRMATTESFENPCKVPRFGKTRTLVGILHVDTCRSGSDNFLLLDEH